MFNPDDWKDVFVLCFVSVCSVAGLALPAYFAVKKTANENAKKLDTAAEKIARIDEQTSNNHDENLRDEITRGFREVREDIRLLATALNIERQERIDGDRQKGAA